MLFPELPNIPSFSHFLGHLISRRYVSPAKQNMPSGLPHNQGWPGWMRRPIWNSWKLCCSKAQQVTKQYAACKALPKNTHVINPFKDQCMTKPNAKLWDPRLHTNCLFCFCEINFHLKKKRFHKVRYIPVTWNKVLSVFSFVPFFLCFGCSYFFLKH